MSHETTEAQVNVTDRDFNEFIQRADDFFKIQLLRQARSWYQKAYELNPQDRDVEQKIAECNRLLTYENKVVRILVSIGIGLTLVYILFFR